MGKTVFQKLNEILEKNKKKLKSRDSTGYSYVKWNQVKNVLLFNHQRQSQKSKSISYPNISRLLQNVLVLLLQAMNLKDFI
jgi:hypothetical protein